MPRSMEPRSSRPALPSIASLDQAVSQIRLAEGGTMRYWVSHGIRPDTLKAHRIGWVSRVGRYTIPYFDSDGNLTGVHLLNPAWTDPNKDKWLWVPGSKISPWPLDKLKTGEPAILCEGETDTLRLRQMGFNAVGVAGCNNLRPHEAEHLASAVYGNPIYVSLDADSEGGAAYARARGMLKKAGVKVLKVKLPEGQDVCSYLNAATDDAYLKLLSNAKETAQGYTLIGSENFQWPDIDTHKIIDPDDNTNFLSLFWRWVRGSCASADAFVIYTGLVCLATFMRRRIVWPKTGVSYTHANLYLLLIAPSGQYKEDMSDRAMRLVDATSKRIMELKIAGDSSSYLMSQQQTPEALHKRLTTQPYGLSIWKEGSGVVAKRTQNYMSGYREQLIELYDCPSHHSRETISGGVQEIRYPVISVLSSIQPQIVETQLPDEVLVSGFLPRFCICGAGGLQSDPHWHQEQPAAQDEHMRDIVEWLLEFVDRYPHTDHEEPGQILSWTEEAREMYRAWVLENHRQEMGTQSGTLASAYKKIEKHAQKLTLLFVVSDMGELLIRPQHVEKAIACIDYQKQVVERVISSRQDTMYAVMKARVLDVLANAEDRKVPRCELLRKTHLSAWQLDQVIDTMTQSGELDGVEVEITGSTRNNRGLKNWKQVASLSAAAEQKAAEAEGAAEYEQATQEETP